MAYGLLKGKRGIIFGALNEQSIAWKVAQKVVEEGATITLTNTPLALRMGELDALAKETGAEVIPADATSIEDLENVFRRSMEVLGGPIDFVLHSIGMSPMCVRRGLTTTWTTVCWKRLWISLRCHSTRCSRPQRSSMPSQRADLSLRSAISQLSVHSVVTTIWQMPRVFWSPSLAVSDSSMATRRACVSTPSLSLRR